MTRPLLVSPSILAADFARLGDEVRAIDDQRCAMCHNAQLAQKNVALHDAAELKRHAQAVYQQVVVLRLMPLNNATAITDAERDAIRRWYEAGAPVN